jgi:GT2 family glycosyltransferase
VIVSIDGSEDGTREMVAGFSAPYALCAIWQPNKGRAAACNTGIRASRGRLLVFLDDDMEPAQGFLAAHVRAHRDSTLLGVVGAAPISIDASSPPVLMYIGAKFNRHLERLAQPGHVFTLRDFYSGNFSVCRDVLAEAGGFDEGFKIYGNEDLDLSIRLRRNGVRLVYDPEALAYQRYTKDFAALARDEVAKGRTAVALATKHPDSFSELKLSGFDQQSWKWRLLRGGLLVFSRMWAGTPGFVTWLMGWLERVQPARLELYFALTLDYFYWLGVQSALRANRRAGREPRSLEQMRAVLQQ